MDLVRNPKNRVVLCFYRTSLISSSIPKEVYEGANTCVGMLH